ncbi:hypothetical protein V5799_013373 [Amblyomma americanum]|uniref:Uncharacterized protein n=1 Tax=Amblyomma americanum TaxID=6943 RepID=A0AAQ4E673_AMBAM
MYFSAFPGTSWVCRETQSSEKSESLPLLPLAAQECPELYNESAYEQRGESLESMLISWKGRLNNVRRRLIFNSPRGEPAAPEHKFIRSESVGMTNSVNSLVATDSENCTHVTVGIQTGATVTASNAEVHYHPRQFQDVVTQTRAAGRSFEVVDTQTDAEYEERDDLSTSFPASISMLELENILELGSGISFLTRSASEESSGLFSSWRKSGRSVQKKRLLFNTRRESGVPDHHRRTQQVNSMVNTERALVGIDAEGSTPVSVSIQTDATIVACCESAHCHPPELKDVITQTEAYDKTFGVTGTQTDVEWENFPSTGHQEGDRELRSLKERLNLAAEEVCFVSVLADKLVFSASIEYVASGGILNPFIQIMKE